MCGRKYNLPSLGWDEYRDLFSFELEAPPSNFAPNYNIAPTHEVPVAFFEDGKTALRPMRWGLLPFWAKDKKVGYRMINARSETVEDKRSFSPLLETHRCIIPVSGFYEWQRRTKTDKQAFAIHRKDEEPLLLAGLWTRNKQIEDGEVIQSYTVMTQRPNALVSQIHDRMPVVLEREQIEPWLAASWDDAKALIEPPYPADRMSAYAIANEVGKVANNYPELLHREGRVGGSVIFE